MIKSFDIIIPVFRPGETFLRLLSCLEGQRLKYSKLIIFNTVPDNDPSMRGKLEEMVSSTVKNMENVIIRHISEAEFDHAGTRRAAAALSKADAFICMTDDAVPADDRLTEILIGALNRDERIAISYARQLPRKEAGPAEAYTRQFNYPDKSCIKSIKDLDRLGIKTFFASNACCAYNKKIYDSIGGFTDTAIFNEDMIYASKALKNGYMSYYRADAMVYHSHSYTPLKEFSRNFDLGVSQAMHPEVFGGIRSESEGIKLVLGTVRYLSSKGRLMEIPGFILRSGLKLLGYRFGKNYERLSDKAVLRLSMNKKYAEKIVAERHKQDHGR